jgi:thioredoxin-like negative regulator of GroEL
VPTTQTAAAAAAAKPHLPQQQNPTPNKTRCGPCVAIGPIIDQLARKYPNVIFLKVDVDKCRNAAASAGVSAMPTLQGFFGGQKIGEIVGADPGRIQALAAELAQRATNAGPGGQGQTVGGGAQKPAATADELRARMAEAAERRARGE